MAIAIRNVKPGDQIRVKDDIDLKPLAFIHAGETGTVVDRQVEPGDTEPTVYIRLDKPHRGLDYYHNEMWVFPQHDDVAEKIERA
jgi:hypothetical protein